MPSSRSERLASPASRKKSEAGTIKCVFFFTMTNAAVAVPREQVRGARPRGTRLTLQWQPPACSTTESSWPAGSWSTIAGSAFARSGRTRRRLGHDEDQRVPDDRRGGRLERVARRQGHGAGEARRAAVRRQAFRDAGARGARPRPPHATTTAASRATASSADPSRIGVRVAARRPVAAAAMSAAAVAAAARASAGSSPPTIATATTTPSIGGGGGGVVASKPQRKTGAAAATRGGGAAAEQTGHGRPRRQGRRRPGRDEARAAPLGQAA